MATDEEIAEARSLWGQCNWAIGEAIVAHGGAIREALQCFLRQSLFVQILKSVLIEAIAAISSLQQLKKVWCKKMEQQRFYLVAFAQKEDWLH